MLRRALARFAFLALLTPLVAANADRHVVLISLDGFPAYLWHDQTIPLPNLRRLAAEGAVADAMTISNPAITWPNHTTLVTGVTPRRHGVLYNGFVIRQGDKPHRLEPWTDKSRLVRVPTVYDAAFAADTIGHLRGATSITGHNVWTARFRRDGSVFNAAGTTPVSANLYIWAPLTAGSLTPRNNIEVRAITIFGGTGAIRYWKYNGATFVPYQ
jgi:hypothetical protein